MISVLITVYNSQETIQSTIQSVLNQSFNEFELVIINDGSTDSTVSVVESFKDSRIKLFNIEKIGRAKALCYGVKCCEYDLIAICDADDLWHPQKLGLQFRYLCENQDVVVLCTKANIFQKDSNVIFGKIQSKDKLTTSRMTLSDMLLVNKVSHSSVMIRKKFALYSDSRESQIDYELWLRLLFSHNIIIECLNETLTYHRIHHLQSFESKGFEYKIKSIKLVNHYAFLSKNFTALMINNIKLFYYLFSRPLIIFNTKYS